ncbi:YqaE/Pmp3 family membrane protein [Pontibacter liquoris]|uniref:YqaE/Pmp3 family membrane protein n=1 Tax=Pontibacter liquoris TaxID=2905677 RepID=UPI001FA6DCF3|nr:YqaE/Pmp3 family membrane protein [Pontibacter liquoris]
MKFRSLLNLAMALIIGQLLFACSSAKYYEFSAQKPEAYNKVKDKPAPGQAVAPTLSEVALAAAEEKAATKAAAPVLEASTVKTPAAAPKKVAALPAAPANVNTAVTPATETKTITEAEAVSMAKARLATMTKAEKKEFKKDVKEAYRASSNTSIVEIILAVLLPPLAVFLHDGIGTSFWISIILTLLFYLPGIIYALLVVTDTI